MKIDNEEVVRTRLVMGKEEGYYLELFDRPRIYPGSSLVWVGIEIHINEMTKTEKDNIAVGVNTLSHRRIKQIQDLFLKDNRRVEIGHIENINGVEK